MSKKGGFKISLYWVYSLIAIALITLYYTNDDSVNKEVPWSTFEEIAKDSDRDYWLSADEALKYGLIDKILVKP